MYTPPGSTAVNFAFTAGTYVAPASTVVNFAFPPSGGGSQGQAQSAALHFGL